MIYHYEERIRRLLGALHEISRGSFGPLPVTSFAKQAIDTDAKLAEQHRREIRGDAGDD